MTNSGISTRTKLFSSGVVAIGLLVGVVLPAEYGMDPTGLGRATGLIDLARAAPVMRNQDFGETLVFNVADYDTTAERVEGSIKGLVSIQDAPFKTETILIEIADLGEVEHKFIMEEDMGLVYAWRVLETEGDGVYYDFHGHPMAADRDDYPADFEMTYSKSEGDHQNGSFTAPFGGLHGFYFMNLEEGPITVELTVSGYFSEHKEVYRAVDGRVSTQLDL